MSISGAGLGNGIPSFDDNEDAKRDGDCGTTHLSRDDELGECPRLVGR